MQYYFAPLEGITDSIYRRRHCQFFGGVHRYYTPFFSPTVHRKLTPKEVRELPPADTLPIPVVPQLLTKIPEDFLWMAQTAKDLGYTEVNLNLGCPSGTVFAKGKGSGMLQDPSILDAFLERIFSNAPMDISVKTRLGVAEPEEFPKLLEIFNRYPIKELILHPRVRKAFYSGNVDMEMFAYCAENSNAPVCFNGNLNSLEEISNLESRFPNLQQVMLGRGLIADPGMLCPGGTTIDKLEAFHDTLLEEYTKEFGGSRNAMFRMKENWRYILCKFEGSEKLGKRLRKTTDLADYKAITQEIFHTLPQRPRTIPDW